MKEEKWIDQKYHIASKVIQARIESTNKSWEIQIPFQFLLFLFFTLKSFNAEKAAKTATNTA